MPSALVYSIRPQAAGSVPTSLSRATHAAFLRVIRAADPELAARVHDDDGPKPITVSNVIGLRPSGRFSPISPERDYTVRVTLLSPELEALAAEWHPQQIGPLDLDGSLWQVEDWARQRSEHDWAGQASYDDLAAPLIERWSEVPDRWEFTFAAPVTFRRKGMNMPLPLPELVFGSLLDKWNAVAPMTLPEEVRRYAEECIAMNRYSLRTVAGPTSGKALQIGAIGQSSYLATNHDKYWRACITTLAQFAFYSGIGAATTRGFGQARWEEPSHNTV